MSFRKKYRSETISLWQVFRLVFVIFSLYLMGDAFYRWDGFRYYASFSEFIPSVALVSILWSILSVLTAVIIWLLLIISRFLIRKTKTGHALLQMGLFATIFLLLSASVWGGKRLLDLQINLSFQHLKTAVLFCIFVAAILITWLLRDKSGYITERIVQIAGLVQKNITPLVWLFGVIVVLSVPLVGYNAWFKVSDKKASKASFQSSSQDKNLSNILLVTFDAMRAQDMSVYGYSRNTTPFITEWAKTASLFYKAEAESNWTAPTTASLMTGKRVLTHRRFNIVAGSNPVNAEIENLPLILKKHGYYNIALIANPLASVNNLGISSSFDVVVPIKELKITGINLSSTIDTILQEFFGHNIRLYNWITQRDFILHNLLDLLSHNTSITMFPVEKAINAFLPIIKNLPEKPFFAWIHLHPPHDKYLPPAPFMGTFDSSPEFRDMQSQRVFLETPSDDIKEDFCVWRTFHSFTDDLKPKVDILRGRYDEFISYCDSQFEELITQLHNLEVLNNTIIVLSADHGESFEHNYMLHGSTLYESETNIPLIIKEPDKIKGRLIKDIVEQIDIPATILDLADISVPSWMEGRSLVPLMRGEHFKPRPAISMSLSLNPSRWGEITKGTIAVWDGNYKLIHHLENKKSMLFNLELDPGEQNNIFEIKPDIGNRLLDRGRKDIDKANKLQNNVNKALSKPE